MRTRFAPLACLAVLLTLAVLGGCTPDAIPPNAPPAPEVADALDWAEAADMEWGAAPWSPPGWPLKVGDRISQETFDELDKRFPSWLNGLAVNWIDGLPFGALIYLEEADSDTPFTYHGHFPRKISAVYETVLAETLPPHLRNRDTDHLFRTPEGYGIDWGIPAEDLREHWHEPWTGRFGDGGKGGGK
ncbi:MAG: hypothetical protein OXP70_11630 [Acidobacteriota bacterium]|nr:hypothetical protein [Acidobacteriota bacterium]